MHSVFTNSTRTIFMYEFISMYVPSTAVTNVLYKSVTGSIHNNYYVIQSPLTWMCTLFSFEAAPPSLHAMIGLCVIGCLSLDLTLLQTALLETNKIAGVFMFFFSHAFCKGAGFMCALCCYTEWKSGDGQPLHSSCVLALRIIMETSHVVRQLFAVCNIHTWLP